MSILHKLRAFFRGSPFPTEPTVPAEQAIPAEPSASPAPTAKDAPARPSIDELAACIGDRDGYVREAALKRAAGLASPQLLPAIFERLNDWVPQVRALVEKAGARAIVDGLLDQDVRVARACCKVVEAARLAPPEAVIEGLLPASRDIVLSQHAAEAIFKLP